MGVWRAEVWFEGGREKVGSLKGLKGSENRKYSGMGRSSIPPPLNLYEMLS